MYFKSILNLVIVTFWQFLGLFNLNYILFYVLLVILGQRFIYFIVLGSLMFGYVYGFNFIVIFVVSFIVWFVGLLLLLFKLSKFSSSSFLAVILLWMFDTFINILRPLTLTLRIFINITLGHVLIEIIYLRIPFVLVFLWLFELFIYLVQRFVFLSLVISYLTYRWALSLDWRISHLRWEGFGLLMGS